MEPSDKRRIRIAVEDAARCYLSTQWGNFFFEAIKYRFRIKALIGIVAAPLLIGFLYLLPKPSIPNIPSSQIHLALFIPLGLLLLLMLFLVNTGVSLLLRLPYVYRTLATIIWAVGAFAVVAILRTRSTYVVSAWKAIVSSLSPIHTGFRMQMALLPVVPVIQSVLFLIGIACTLVIAAKLIIFCGRVATSGKAVGYSEPAIQSADVIISLLHIGNLITELMAPIQTASADVKGYPNKRSQITTSSWNATWNAINGQLSSLSYQIKGPWQEGMRSYYGPAGERIASEAPRIELFIRHQQAKNCLLSNNLFKLRDAITSTLVHAADGDWHLIGSEEEYANTVIARRRSKIIRRAIAIGVSIVCAVAALVFIRHYPALYTGIVVTCLGFALAQLPGLLDPDAPTGLDVASNRINELKRGG